MAGAVHTMESDNWAEDDTTCPHRLVKTGEPKSTADVTPGKSETLFRYLYEYA
jgi:hypothetical protein